MHCVNRAKRCLAFAIMLCSAAFGGEVTITASDPSAAEEGLATGAFTFTRAGGTAGNLTVFFTVGGSATNGADYNAIAASIVIPDTQASAVLTITPIDDAAAESDETVVLTLSPDAAYTIGPPGNATVTIVDSEPVVTISASDPSASESMVPPGPSSGAFTVFRTGSTGTDLTVNFTVGGTAIPNVDYTAFTGMVVIPAGQSSETLNLIPLDDSLAEGPETVVLTLAAGSYGIGSPNAATVTILDDEPVISVFSSVAGGGDPTATEGTPATDTGTYRFVRTINTMGALTVNFTVSGGSASAADFVALSGSVSFADGQSAATATLTPVDDALAEGSETVTITISPNAAYVVGTSSSATVTILDNEPTVSVTATDDTASETGPDTGTFTITRINNTTGNLTVNFTLTGTAANGADYATLSGSVVIPNGSPSITVVVTPIDDLLVEGSETVVLSITPDPAYFIGSNSATVTILDNDTSVQTVSVTAADALASEPGLDTGTFTLTRAGDTSGDLTVNFTISGAAANGIDYVFLAGSGVIPAGQASAVIGVTPIDDLLIEGNETVVLTITPSAAYLIGIGTATVTIVDNDGPQTVSVTAADALASEPGLDTGTFTLTRAGDTSGDLTVNFTISGAAANGIDYVFLAGSGVIPAGQASAVIGVTPIDDFLIEGNETVVLSITPDAAYLIGIGTATVTIADDDTPLTPVVTVAATDPTSAEAGPDTGTLTFTRTGNTSAALTVNITVTGSASVDDFQPIPATVDFAAGQAAAQLVVTPINDTLLEPSETVVVTLNGGSGYTVGAPASATVTILDDDSPQVSITAPDASAQENPLDGGSFTVARSGSTAGDLLVSYSVGGTATAGADYIALSGTAVIPDGQASVAVPVTPIDDTVLETPETVVVSLTAGAGYSVGSPAAATVTIGSDEIPLTATVITGDPNAAESPLDNGSFTVTLSAAAPNDVTVNYTNSGTAGSGSDYAALPGSVLIPAGATSAAIALVPVNDTLVEGSETVVLTLAAGAGYIAGTPSSATANIVSEDLPMISIAPTSDAGEFPLLTGLFTVTADQPSPAEILISYTVSGSATPTADYSPLSGTVRIPPGQTSATIAVTPVQDTLTESAETITVTLSGGASFTLAPISVATLTIAEEMQLPFTVEKGSAKFLLVQSGGDGFKLSGVFPLLPGFSPAGASVLFQIGVDGPIFQFTLDAKGASVDRAFRLRGKLKNGVYISSEAKFSLSIRRQDLLAAFNVLGVPNQAVKSGVLEVPIQAFLGGTAYLDPSATIIYSVIVRGGGGAGGGTPPPGGGLPD